MKNRAAVIGLFLFLILFSIQCAKIEYPPGGPADILPPEILGSQPHANELNVLRDADIRIEFSEKISKEDLLTQVYIVPEPDPPPLIRIKNRDLVIEFRDSLAADQTYLITLKTGLADLRRNKLKQPFKLAFSTGANIDKGKIDGKIYKDFKPAANADVWAFRADSALTIFNRRPDYITQSNDSGIYQLEYLRMGRYLCFAVEDQRSDRKYDPAADIIGIPTGAVMLDSNSMLYSNINFNLFKQDTARLRLVSAKYTTDKLIMLKFSGLIKASALSINNFKIISTGDSLAIDSFEILSGVDTTDNVLLIPHAIPEYGTYQITANGIIGIDDRNIAADTNAVEVRIDSTADTNPPKLLSFFPADNSRSFPTDSALCFTFSEPIIADSSLLDSIKLESLDSLSYTNFEISTHGLNLFVMPPDTLIEGQSYVFSIDLSQVRDLSGNAVSDSMRQIKFSILNKNEFGSISGQMQLTAHSFSNPKILVRNLNGGLSTALALDESYKFSQQLPTGSYQFYGFDDLDSNGIYKRGNIMPLDYAEPFILFPDTISIRSRFETEDIILKITP